MNLRKDIGALVVAMLLFQTNAICQTSAFPTNFTYFKANIVNDTNNLVAAMKAYRHGEISKEEIMLVVLATLNDEPITFYGKVEDQFGHAIGNASISFNIRVYNGLVSTVNRGQVVSDAAGFFKISGYHGQDLSMVPHIKGYALASTSTIFKYSHMDTGYFVPDQSNPVVIKMWKIQGAEPLVDVGKKYKLHYTNTPICFDLITGTIVTNGGDIRITVNRPPGIISARNQSAWNVKFEAIDGGIMDSSAETTTYYAPENGYQPSKIISSINNLPTHGYAGFRIGFYLKSRNGQVYSKLTLDFGINRNPDDSMCIEFGGIANTNFSRNWEGAGGTYLNPGY